MVFMTICQSFRLITYWKGESLAAPKFGITMPVQLRFVQIRRVHWHKPALGSFKLNTDGSSKGNPGQSGVGGILGDCQGNPLVAFQDFIGTASNKETENNLATMISGWN
ncbi:hypothetical protein Pfo_010209 [Paulownia fortunei]|nr:hypothetical protein Pfo_010209 [Paulownia fortunei]